VIAGDFDPAEAKRLVEKYFANIPAGPPLDRPTRSMASLSSEKIVEAIDRVPQERVYMIWPSPRYFAPGDAELDLVSLILTDGLASRLNKVLVYDKQLCTAVNSFNNQQEIAGMFGIIATARPGSTLPQIEAIVTEEISRLAKTGPTAEELARAKTKQEYTFVSGLERIGGFGGKADLLNQYNTFLGDPGKFDEDVARYRKASAEDVRSAAATWLDTRNRLLIRFRPETAGRASETALDRSKEPALGTDRPFRAPEVASAKLENGLEIFVVERHELPKVSVTLATRAGSVAEPHRQGGPRPDDGDEHAPRNDDAEGPRDRGFPREPRNRHRGHGRPRVEPARPGGPEAQPRPGARHPGRRRAQPVLSGLGARTGEEAAARPAFAAVEERQRDLRPHPRDAPLRADHPYGHPTQGLPASIEKLARADLVEFHKARWKPGSSAIVFVGDVTLAEVTELARRSLGAWSGGAAAPVTVPPASPAASGKVYLVDRQDAAQTVVSQILPAPERSTPDYYALQLADSVWGGGGFGTRLNLNLRENKGYSYGVFSTLVQYHDAGYWYASGGVQTNKTKESVVEFVGELNGIAGGKPITPEEFETAKVKRVRGYSQQFEGLSRVGGEIAGLWALGFR
jgi:zinc protease